LFLTAFRTSITC